MVLVSPYSWLPGWTAREQWYGGKKDGPRAAAEISAVLSKDFVLVAEDNVPFLIREHARKFQYGVSHATLWRRS